MSTLTTQPTVVPTAAVNPFTRRTFMKTSALTVGAVTLLSKGTALAEEGTGSSSGGLLLVCIDEPANASFNNAWPSTWKSAVRSQKIFHERDHFGEGVDWSLVHWVELSKWPKRRDAVPAASGSHFGQAIAHMLVTKSYWRYDSFQPIPFAPKKKEWVTRTIAHLTAGGITKDHEMFQVTTSNETTLVYADVKDNSNKKQPEPLKNWEGATVGWALVSLVVTNFCLRSDAVFVPKSIKKSDGFSYSLNVSAEIVKGVGVSGGFSYQTAFELSAPPPASPIELNWTFAIRKNLDNIDKSDNWQPPNPGITEPKAKEQSWL